MAKSAEVKLAIFGRAGVGKSALVVRFLTKRFIWEYDPTLENTSAVCRAFANDHHIGLMARLHCLAKLPFCESTYRHQATIDDEVVTMEILDTAGQEDTIQREGHMRWGEGFVLVYDITDRGSFEEVLPLKNILDEIKKPKNVTLILVGNKADLDHSRQVSTEEGEKLATELACAFYECSACTGEGNITEIFYELCREVRRRRMVQGKTRRRSSTTHVKQAINKMLTKISS
ncbi:ras-related and estrogen-regulated growth inhibitor isoform X1 [Moschus berezovskii]|uniref:ras-related and estrogen-regulated growth inhibitor isoform X1 n=1 Tax=Moschus berezovskii TaxID=68408 RepID=UPI00244430DB|nr:ras-related and estrogen-regulated growth inhibitor isoform X1 [Moschus berezovskii]